jgi:hypothetical protein
MQNSCLSTLAASGGHSGPDCTHFPRLWPQVGGPQAQTKELLSPANDFENGATGILLG